MTAADRPYDVLLFGATGFVGRLTAAHLAEHAPAGARIALAGRSRERLERVAADLGGAARQWPLVVVDAADPAQVRELAESTVAVATTVGPYAKYGKPLLAACAAAGTHYADLTGEVLFVKDMIDAHHDEAVSTGARIVNSCGFDSIPSDLGVWLTAQTVAQDGEGTLGETLLHVRSLRGGFSGGTIDSMREQVKAATADPAARRAAGDPYGLSPDRQAEPPHRNRGPRPTSRLGKLKAALPTLHDPLTGRWIAPFFMGPYNTRVVRRSNALTHWSYGREFRYDEVIDTGSGPMGAVVAGAATAVMGGVVAGMAFTPTRMILDRVLPAPGEGPSEEAMAKGRFVLQIETTTTTGARYRTTVASETDPGYTGTAIMLGESALALALDGDRLPDCAGVITPATGIGEVLIDRLRGHGFTFRCEQLNS